MSEKKIPMRMCVVCRGRFQKSELTRVVLAPDGTVTIDKSGKAAGRGAYLCSNPHCVEVCLKKKMFNRSIKKEVPAQVYEQFKPTSDENR